MFTRCEIRFHGNPRLLMLLAGLPDKSSYTLVTAGCKRVWRLCPGVGGLLKVIAAAV